MRSRLCPIWQYNKDKPKQFRIKFFVLANGKDYFAYHLDVYQGKNGNIIGEHQDYVNFFMKAKVVVNIIVQS